MDLLKLFDLQYLFASVPGGDFKFRWLAYGVFLLIFVGSFFVKKMLSERPLAKIEKLFFSGIPFRMQEFAIAGLLISFFRDQNIPYLGMRAWFLGLVLIAIGYALAIWRNYRKNFAQLLLERSSKKVEDLYLPTKKKSTSKKRR